MTLYYGPNHKALLDGPLHRSPLYKPYVPYETSRGLAWGAQALPRFLLKGLLNRDIGPYRALYWAAS